MWIRREDFMRKWDVNLELEVFVILIAQYNVLYAYYYLIPSTTL